MMDSQTAVLPADAESLLSLLRARRSIYNFLPDPVPDDLLREALDAGRFAANHKLTEPWRFTVLGPETREAIVEPWAEFAAAKLPPDAAPERKDEVREAARQKWLSKPTVVVVTQVEDPDPMRREEDYAAVAAAIQNIQLAAWALGLGCQWSTSPATRNPGVLAHVDLPEGERVVAFLFVGYPALVPEARRRPLDEVTRWTP